MKKLTSLLVVFAVLCAAGIAGAAALLIHDKTTAVNVIAADVRSASFTSNDISVRQYYGQGKIVLDAEAQGSGITNAIKIQASDLATGATSTAWPTGDTDIDLNLSTGGTPTIAASFTQSGVRQVKHIDLKLKKTGTIASDKVLTLTIEGDSAGDPDGSAVATAGTVLANTISSASYQTVRFTLTTPVALADATAYWIVIRSNYAASDTNYISWYVDTVASGGTASTSNGSTWTADTTADPIYKVYQYNFADYVEFTNVVNTASLQSKAIDLDSAGTHIRGVSTVSGGSSTGAYSLVLIAPTQNQ